MAEHLRGEPARARRARAPAPSGACMPRASDDRHHERRARASPSGSGSPAGLVGEQPVVDGDVEREPDAASISAASSTGHQRSHGGASTTAASSSGSERARAATRSGLSACTTCLHPPRKPWAAYFAPASVSAAGKAHCAGDARERERPRRVGERRHGASRARARSSPSAVSSPCSSTSAASSGSCSVAAPEPGRADHLVGAVHRRLDAEPPLGAARARAARPTRAPGGYDGAEQLARAAPPARPGSGGGTPRGRAARRAAGAR